MNKAASQLGKLAKGIPKSISIAERKRRAERLRLARRKRWPKLSLVPGVSNRLRPLINPKMKTLPEMFPNASQSTLERNPHLGHGKAKKNDSSAILSAKRGIMNKTEAEFALMLEAQKRNGEILRYEYEGITLRWYGISYTPDFVVFDKVFSSHHHPMRIIEVKGPFIKGKFERAIERFRHARTYWPEFGFELWQKTKEGWIRKQ